MSKSMGLSVVSAVCLLCSVQIASAQWNPASEVSREEIVKASKAVLAMPDMKLKAKEDIFRVRTLDMAWDMGAMVYEPQDPLKIPTGPDGNKIGVFLIHGGSGDHRSKDKEARFLVSKFGYMVVSMTYP